MSHYVDQLYLLFGENANLEKAHWMAAYMKGKFPFFGLMTPIRKKLEKEHFTGDGKPSLENYVSVVDELWQLPERECQHAALSIYSRFYKRLHPGSILHLEKLIVSKSWWDTVDLLAVQACGAYFALYPEKVDEITNRWMSSGNIWLQRSCLLFQLKYKKATDFEMLKAFILELKGSNEFFIQKAVGWALREYGKTEPELVWDFCQTTELKPLSSREALRIIRKTKP